MFRRGNTSRWARFYRRISQPRSPLGSSHCRRWFPIAHRTSGPRTTRNRPAYLVSAANDAAGGIDITLEAYLETAAMHAHRETPQRLSSTSFRHSFWTLAQLVAHHTVNGCNLRAGDLLGTGTQSGPGPGEAGSLLELSSGGKHPMRVGSSEHRTFLEDGDTVIFRAWCARPGAARIGFGEVRGRVLPAAAD